MGVLLPRYEPPLEYFGGNGLWGCYVEKGGDEEETKPPAELKSETQPTPQADEVASQTKLTPDADRAASQAMLKP